MSAAVHCAMDCSAFSRGLKSLEVARTPSNEELAVRVQRGEYDLMAAIWYQTRRLAYIMARRYKQTAAVDLDDLMQCAYLGVFNAALAYKPSAGSFGTVMGWYVAKECGEALGLRKKELQASASLDAPLSEESDGQTLEDFLPDNAMPDITCAMEQEDMVKDVHAAVDALPDDLRDVVHLRYFGGLQHDQIADLTGLNVYRVRRNEAAALRQLRSDRIIQLYDPRAEYRPIYADTYHGKDRVVRTVMTWLEDEKV